MDERNHDVAERIRAVRGVCDIPLPPGSPVVSAAYDEMRAAIAVGLDRLADEVDR